MYEMIEKWLDSILTMPMPDNTKAFCINMYDDGDGKWSAEIVATDTFNIDNSDWGCDEIDDFGTRENPFEWCDNSCWENVLANVKAAVIEYLSHGAHAAILKSVKGLGLGFTDGNLHILYTCDM